MTKYIAVFSLLLLFACELVVDVDVPFDGQRLTLNSFPNPDSLWSATLHLNRHILDDSYYPEVDGALVIIYDGEAPIDTLASAGIGRYRSDTGRPVPGKTYTIKASAAGYETVTAKSNIPFPAEITYVDIKEKISGDQVETLIQLKFNDNGAETNYYHVSVETVRDQLLPEGIIKRGLTTVYIESEETGFEENTYNAEGLLIKDLLFNGKEAGLTLKIPGYYGWDLTTLIVKLKTVNEEYFRYKTTAQLQRNTSGDPFAQPVNVFCNIENGFGIFAGYSTSEFTRAGPPPEITAINPMFGKIGDTIIISGENFLSATQSQDIYVAFTASDYYAYSHPLAIRPNEIEVQVPPNAVTGKIYVVVRGRIAPSASEFEVIN